MKIIDLLNKIAKGEEVPEEFKYKDRYFSYRDNDYWCNEIGGWFSVEVLVTDILNDEVEIIEEEKEIEKLELGVVSPNNEYIISVHDEKIQDKINEIIDVINDMRDKEWKKY